jgi:DHA1 family tetracycline resistance protein-like MFS transporter
MRRPTLGAIFLTVFLDLLGFGLVMPFLAQEATERFGASPFVATLLGSIYSFMQFLFVPVWGRLSDRIGRRPVILWSVAATVLSMVGLGAGLAFGASIVWLFVARAFSGIATANLGTASAYIADITKPEERTKGMGLFGIAFGLGFILGPGIGGPLSEIPVFGHTGPLPCFVAAGLSLVNLVWAYFGLAESLPKTSRDTRAARSLAPMNFAVMARAFSHPGVGLAVAVNFLGILAFTNLDQTFSLYCGSPSTFSMTRGETGYVLAFIGIVAAIVQGGVVRPLSKRVPDATLIRVGVLLQIFAFAGIVAAGALRTRALLFASGALLALGNGFTQPTMASFISTRAPKEEQGGTLGTNQSFAALARTFGPAMGGVFYDEVGPLAPYLAAAVGMAVALAFAFGLHGRIPGRDAPAA